MRLGCLNKIPYDHIALVLHAKLKFLPRLFYGCINLIGKVKYYKGPYDTCYNSGNK